MKNYLLAFSILSCIVLAGCTAGYVTTRPADVTYVRPYLLDLVMYGLAANGNGAEVIITGMKDPGNMPERRSYLEIRILGK